MRPALLVIAGPNGAGKTTITGRLRQERWSDGVEYLNPDEIARDRFGDWNSPEASLQAARWTTARREALLRDGAGIAFETVFSTQDKVDFVARAKQRGYFVRVFFIGTEDPRINAARIAGRVMQGGHTVPIEKIVARHGRSMANLSSAIVLADRVYVYDNSVDGAEARLCARTVPPASRASPGSKADTTPSTAALDIPPSAAPDHCRRVAEPAAGSAKMAVEWSTPGSHGTMRTANRSESRWK